MKPIDTEKLIKTVRERREEAFRWKANADSEKDRIKASGMITAFTDVIVCILEMVKES